MESLKSIGVDWHSVALAHEAKVTAQATELARLRGAILEIKMLKPTQIADTGFQTGPLALLQAAQRIARAALEPQQLPRKEDL